MQLREDSPTLYRRVRLKGIMHLILGTILIFFPTQALSFERTPLLSLVGQEVLGGIFLAIGIMIFLGLSKWSPTYNLARIGLWLALIFNILIFFSLVSVFVENRTTTFVLAMYGYFCYNLNLIVKDPSWLAVHYVKNIKKEIEDQTR